MEIYKTTNLINGKIYIGQSKFNNPNYYGSGKILNYAIKKYGKENFKKEILEECQTKEELNKKEKFWIKYYNSIDRNIGYNISEGGSLIKHTEETKKKLSDKAKKRYKNKNNHPRYKTKHTTETKKKMSDNHADISGEKNPMKKKKQIDYLIEKYGEIKGREIWKNRGQKISQKMKNKKRPDISLRMKKNNPFKGKHHSKKTKDKMSQLKKKKVLQFNLDNNFIREWESLKQIYLELGYQVTSCCKGKTKTSNGYKWKYKV